MDCKGVQPKNINFQIIRSITRSETKPESSRSDQNLSACNLTSVCIWLTTLWCPNIIDCLKKRTKCPSVLPCRLQLHPANDFISFSDCHYMNKLLSTRNWYCSFHNSHSVVTENNVKRNSTNN